MSKNPFLIAAIVTALVCVPLYLISSQEFVLTVGNLPLFALSLFIAILVSIYWSKIDSGNRASGSATNFDSRGIPRESGNVKWFNANKGFGFITRDSGEDIFVHFRSIRGKGHRVLHDGQRVEFAVSEGDKGLQAEDVAAAP